MSPLPPNSVLGKGYLTLSSEFLQINPTFELNIPLKPRYTAPHPYTGQDILALARGPIVYCIEDIDNPWVDDHFKSLVLDPAAKVTEEASSDIDIGQQYISLVAHSAASFLNADVQSAPFSSIGQTLLKKSPVERLNFIPYCLRDNRGGKGHMRVGIRRKS